VATPAPPKDDGKFAKPELPGKDGMPDKAAGGK
jgi:hypothetical protein